jgi:hypothetical protein
MHDGVDCSDGENGRTRLYLLVVIITMIGLLFSFLFFPAPPAVEAGKALKLSTYNVDQ